MRRPWIVGGVLVGSAGLAFAATGGLWSIAWLSQYVTWLRAQQPH